MEPPSWTREIPGWAKWLALSGTAASAAFGGLRATTVPSLAQYEGHLTWAAVGFLLLSAISLLLGAISAARHAGKSLADWWRERNQPKPCPQPTPPTAMSLKITSEVIDPEHIGPPRRGARSSRRYALLRVKNVGADPIPSLVAELVYSSSDPRVEPRTFGPSSAEDHLLIPKTFASYGLWSGKPGTEYVPPEESEATINPGSTRCLLVATARLVNIQSSIAPSDGKRGAVIWNGVKGNNLDPLAPLMEGPTVHGDGVIERFQALHLGEAARVSVAFRSARGELLAHYTLGVDIDPKSIHFGVAATLREIATPSAAQPDSTADS